MVGHDGHRGAMYYVSVDPAAGPGLGRQIVAAAEAWLKARGVWKVNLLVRKGNEAVLGFYDGLGLRDRPSVQIEKWIDPSKRGDRKAFDGSSLADSTGIAKRLADRRCIVAPG